MDVKLDDEDKAIILLGSLPKSFEQLMDGMLYGRKSSITLEEVQSVLRSKELLKHNEVKSDATPGESLNVKQKQGKGGKNNKPSQVFKKPVNQKGKDYDEKETRRCHF